METAASPMTGVRLDRREQILAMLSGGDPDESFLVRVCEVATALLGVSGAGVCVVGGALDEVVVHGTDDVATGLEHLQVSLAQGPCLVAIQTGTPVLVGDLEGLTETAWHGYRESALALGARAVFCFPLQTDAGPTAAPTDAPEQIGALDLYRVTPVELDHDQVADALLISDVIASVILDQRKAVALDVRVSVVRQLFGAEHAEPEVRDDLDLTVGQASQEPPPDELDP